MNFPSNSYILEARLLEVEENAGSYHKIRILRIYFDKGSKVEIHSASLYKVVTLLSFYFKIYCGLLVKTKLKIKNN
jgi:hypothetical protein